MHEDSMRSGYDPPLQQLPPQVQPYPATLFRHASCCGVCVIVSLCQLHVQLLQETATLHALSR